MEFADKGSDVENLAPNEVVVTSEMQDLKNLCTQFGLSSFGPRYAVIKRLVKQGILKASDYSLDGGSFSVKGGRKQPVPINDNKERSQGTQSVHHKKLQESQLKSKDAEVTNHKIQPLPSNSKIDLLTNKDRTKEQSSVNNKDDDTDSDSSVECLDISDDESDRKKAGSSSFPIPTQILFSRHFNPVNEPSDENKDLDKDESSKQSVPNNIHKESTPQKKSKEMWITSKKDNEPTVPNASGDKKDHEPSVPKTSGGIKSIETKKKPVKKNKQMFVSDTMSSLMDLMNYGDVTTDEDGEENVSVEDDRTKEDKNNDRIDDSDSDTSIKYLDFTDDGTDMENESNEDEDKDKEMDCGSETSEENTKMCQEEAEEKSNHSMEEAEEESNHSREETEEESNHSQEESESSSDSDDYQTADNATPNTKSVSNQDNSETNNFFAFGSFVTATGSAEKVKFSKDDPKVELPFVPFGSFVSSTGSPEVVKFKMDSKKDSETAKGTNVHLDPKLGKWVNCPPEEDEKIPKTLELIDHDVLELSDNKRTVERKPVSSGFCADVVVVDQSIVNFSNSSENDEKMMNILSILENDHKQFSIITRTGGDTTEELKEKTPVKKSTKETVVVLNNSKKSKKSKSKTGNNNFVAWGTFEDASGSAEKVQFISNKL